MAVVVDVAVDEGVGWPAGWDEHQVVSDARAMLAVVGLVEVELSVMLTDDAGIQALNAQWRGRDTPTDVLSFPQQDPPVGPGLLGDVVISVDTAARQADDLGHDLVTELRVLLAHGLGHLIGQVHDTPDDARAMRAHETRLLEAVGAPEGAALVARAEADG